MSLIFLVQTAPSIVIELPAALTAMVGLIAALIALIAFLLRRELKANDQAHKGLRDDIKTVDTNLRADIRTVESDVKKLLEGQGRIEGALGILIGQRREDAG